MNINSFLHELSFYFPTPKKLGAEELEKLFSAYTEDILYEINKWDGYNCDFQILLREIRSSYQYEKFPSIATIISYLPKAKVLASKSKPVTDEGSIIRVTLDNGYIYDFTVVSFDAKTTLDSIKKRFSYKDENGNAHTKIKKIVRYPRETTFIGDKVYFNVNFSNAAKMSDAERKTAIAQKEKELESQIKVLFTAL